MDDEGRLLPCEQFLTPVRASVSRRSLRCHDRNGRLFGLLPSLRSGASPSSAWHVDWCHNSLKRMVITVENEIDLGEHNGADTRVPLNIRWSCFGLSIPAIFISGSVSATSRVTCPAGCAKLATTLSPGSLSTRASKTQRRCCWLETPSIPRRRRRMCDAKLSPRWRKIPRSSG